MRIVGDLRAKNAKADCKSRHDLSYLGIGAKHPSTPRDITRKLRGLPMASPEKQKYMLYNNMMYTVASHLVEVKTGRPFAEFLQSKFFQPLGMTSTCLQPSSAITAGQSYRLASGHQFDEASGNWDVFEDADAPEGQGAGSIITSAADYIKWVRAMLHHQAPISKASRTALTIPRILIKPREGDLDPLCSPYLYCMGWETYHYRGHQVVIHDGLIDGFGSSHFFLPAHDFGGVILGNSDGAEQVCWILARELIDEALDVPQTERPDWAALQAAKLAEEDDIDTGDGIRELRERLSSAAMQPEKPAPPLDAFVGDYSDLGYGSFRVEIRDGSLFIDATDRGFPCTFSFEHVRTWHTYAERRTVARSGMIAHLYPVRGSPDEHLAAEFVFDVVEGDEQATKMAIALDPDSEMIWFEKM